VTPPRYLVVKLAALGDVAMTSALSEAIRQREPEARVTWLCGSRVAELVRLLPGVHEVIAVDETRLLRGSAWARAGALLGIWRALAVRRFDTVLLAHVDRRYRALVLTVRAGAIRALQRGPSPRTLPIAGRYHGDEYARLLDGGVSRGPIAGHYPLADLRAVLPPRRDRAPVGVVLVAGGTRNVLRESALRRWPVEAYAEVARQLRRAGHPVTLVGDAADAWVRPAFAGVDIRDEIGVHDLPATLGLLRDAELVISHDTGPMHLARLVRAPLLALFGPTMPSQFVVEDERTQVIWGGGTLACRPCYDGREFAACSNNLCMKDIAVAAVLDRALSMLAGSATGRLSLHHAND
jgi:heptosyltransferase-2